MPKLISRCKNQITRGAQQEKELLATGGTPPARIKNKIQRITVKALLGFFFLILVFTIVSRAADGYTVAMVDTDTVKSGVITNKTSVNGSIKPLEDLDITLPGDIYVNDVKSGAGAVVSAGDVLLEFDIDDVQQQLALQRGNLEVARLKLELAQSGVSDADNSAIENARRALELAREDYERTKEKLDRGSLRTGEDLRAAEEELKKAESDYVAAEKKAKDDLIKAAEEKLKNAQSQLNSVSDSADDAIANAQYAVDRTDPSSAAEYNKALDDLYRAQSKWWGKISEASSEVSKATAELKAAKETTDLTGQPGVISAQAGLDAAKRSLLSAQRAAEDSEFSYEEQLLTASRAVESAERNLEQATKDAKDKALNNESSRKQAEIEAITLRSEIQSLEKSVALLSDIAASGGKLLSPASGTVQSITQTGKTQEKVPVATISLSSHGFFFEGKLTAESAAELELGGTGTLSYTSRGKSYSVDAVITEIGAVDDDGNVPVKASLPEGQYTSGTAAELTVTQTSDRQFACLPLGALRSDSGGDYVLVLREKKTVLGTEQTAVKVPVTVRLRDSELMSVDSALSRDDKVITSASKPVSEGDRVRLEKD